MILRELFNTRTHTNNTPVFMKHKLMRYWWSVLIACVVLQLLMEAINGCSVFLAQLHLGTLLFEEI